MRKDWLIYTPLWVDQVLLFRKLLEDIITCYGREATRRNLHGRCQDSSYLSKTRRFRCTSANTEDSRASQAVSKPNTSWLSNKEHPRERWKETAEGRAKVGRLWAFWSADPTSSNIGSRFLFYHVFSRV